MKEFLCCLPVMKENMTYGWIEMPLKKIIMDVYKKNTMNRKSSILLQNDSKKSFCKSKALLFFCWVF